MVDRAGMILNRLQCLQKYIKLSQIVIDPHFSKCTTCNIHKHK